MFNPSVIITASAGRFTRTASPATAAGIRRTHASHNARGLSPANPAFAAKVPVKVLEEHQARLQEWQVKEAQIAASLANLAA
jgi:hypothetical protein